MNDQDWIIKYRIALESAQKHEVRQTGIRVAILNCVSVIRTRLRSKLNRRFYLDEVKLSTIPANRENPTASAGDLRPSTAHSPAR